jgi:hypothetical protein
MKWPWQTELDDLVATAIDEITKLKARCIKLETEIEELRSRNKVTPINERKEVKLDSNWLTERREIERKNAVPPEERYSKPKGG